MPAGRGTAGSPDVAAVFAKHLTSVAYADLPPAVVAATKRSILDTVGVMLAGSGSESGRAIARLLRRWGGRAESTLIGHRLRLPAVSAAFANGAAAHQYDFDDTHDEAVAHPTANSLSAALAVAESEGGCSGADLILAVALANDLVCRLGLAIKGSLYEYPWTRPPIIGIYGATAAAAVILKLTPEQIEWAFGLTLHQTANTLECLYAPGSDVRGLRDGFSVRNGVTAAYMAREGIHGDRSAFEGRFGLFNAYFRGEYDRTRLVEDLGRRFHGAEVSIKPWPSARETHATIQAVLDLCERERLTPEDIENVHLYVGRTNHEFCEPAAARRRPQRRMDALSSLPYAVSVAIRFGRIPLSAYAADRLSDPEVLAIADRVTWELDDAMSEAGTIEGGRVRVRTRDGRVLEGTARHGLGHPDFPLPPALERQKFLDCAALAAEPLEAADLERLVTTIHQLETRTVADLSAGLAGRDGKEARP